MGNINEQAQILSYAEEYDSILGFQITRSSTIGHNSAYSLDLDVVVVELRPSMMPCILQTTIGCSRFLLRLSRIWYLRTHHSSLTWSQNVNGLVPVGMPSYIGPTLFRYLFGPHRLKMSYRGVKRQRLAAVAGVEHASYAFQ